MPESCAKNGLILRASLALAFACLVWALPAAAKAGWTAPAEISGPGTSVSQTQVAGGTNGDSWVVWKRNVGGFDVIQGTRVQIDGSQGPIVTISSPAMQATDPVIEARDDGSAMVAWLNLSAVDDTVQSRSIAADGTLGTIQTRSAVGPAGRPAADIDIALGEDGTAGLTWIKYNGSKWVAQAVKVAADDSSGTIHNLSDGTLSAGPPAIGALAPAALGESSGFRVFWPQGGGTDSNVGNRDIGPDDSVTDEVLVYAAGDDCQDPFDLSVTFGVDGAMNAFWVCYRKSVDTSTFTEFFNWTAQWLRVDEGSTVTPGFGTENASPASAAAPYKISALASAGSPTTQPALAWVHDLNGGGQRVETWRVQVYNPTGGLNIADGAQWANPTATADSVDSPAIAVKGGITRADTAVAGGVEQGLLPGQPVFSFARFSNATFGPQTPSGAFVYSEDPGFVLAESGKTLAVFTGIDGLSVGSAQVMAYSDPSMQVNPDNLFYGAGDIGISRQSFITIRSNGESSNTVTGVSLSGANADRFSLDGANECVREMLPGTNCRFAVNFKPGSTATQTAKVTVTSESGSEDVNLSGSGLNRTRNRISLNKRNFAARKGKVVRIRATLRNNGGVTSNNTRVCVNLRKRALKLAGNRCRSIGALPSGASRTLKYRIRVTWRVPRGKKLPVTFVMRANNALVRQVVAKVRRKGR